MVNRPHYAFISPWHAGNFSDTTVQRAI